MNIYLYDSTESYGISNSLIIVANNKGEADKLAEKYLSNPHNEPIRVQEININSKTVIESFSYYNPTLEVKYGTSTTLQT